MKTDRIVGTIEALRCSAFERSLVMRPDFEKFFPLAWVYENKPPLPKALRPFYHVLVRDAEELATVTALQPAYVDASYTVLANVHS